MHSCHWNYWSKVQAYQACISWRMLRGTGCTIRQARGITLLRGQCGQRKEAWTLMEEPDGMPGQRSRDINLKEPSSTSFRSDVSPKLTISSRNVCEPYSFRDSSRHQCVDGRVILWQHWQKLNYQNHDYTCMIWLDDTTISYTTLLSSVPSRLTATESWSVCTHTVPTLFASNLGLTSWALLTNTTSACLILASEGSRDPMCLIFTLSRMLSWNSSWTEARSGLLQAYYEAPVKAFYTDTR